MNRRKEKKRKNKAKWNMAKKEFHLVFAAKVMRINTSKSNIIILCREKKKSLTIMLFMRYGTDTKYYNNPSRIWQLLYRIISGFTSKGVQRSVSFFSFLFLLLKEIIIDYYHCSQRFFFLCKNNRILLIVVISFTFFCAMMTYLKCGFVCFRSFFGPKLRDTNCT